MTLYICIGFGLGFLWLACLCFNLHTRLLTFHRLAHAEYEYNEKWRNKMKEREGYLLNRMCTLESGHSRLEQDVAQHIYKHDADQKRTPAFKNTEGMVDSGMVE